MPHAMAGNLYKAAFSIRFTSVSPEIETLLQDLTATTALADEASRSDGARSLNFDAEWVKPQLVARVRHLAGTTTLRHATVRAIG